MTLHVDEGAEKVLAGIVFGLRSVRRDAGFSQNALSSLIPVRSRAVSEWETGSVEPTLKHLIQWSRGLGRRLVIVGPDGESRTGPALLRTGESGEAIEQRRLAVPLRNRRLALGLTQEELGQLVGVSRDSIQRWELVRVPPRPIALIVWAQRLGCSVVMQPIDAGNIAQGLTAVGS